MNARRFNLLLWSAAAACLAAALLVVIAGVTLPLDPAGDGTSRPAHAVATRSATRPTDAHWADADWSRPLRGPLTTAAAGNAGSVNAQPEAEAPGPITLLGTIGESLAI